MLGNTDQISPDGALEHGVERGTGGGNRLMSALLIAAISASALSMIFSIGTAVLSSRTSDQTASAPATQRPIGSITPWRHQIDAGTSPIAGTDIA